MDAFDKLKNDILACRKCEERFGFTPNPVVHGRRKSKIMQISQAPSKNVHLTNKPFDDITGVKLKKEWYELSDDIFYDTSNFYITSMGHCFPGKTKSGGDRLPPKICADTFLKKEMDLVDCDLYIIIGAKASNYIFKNQDFTSMVFDDHTLNGKPCFILPHPSPLNIRWFKKHPEFEQKRIKEVRDKIYQVLNLT